MKKLLLLILAVASFAVAQYPKDVIATSYPEGEVFDIEYYLDQGIYVIVMHARVG